VTRKAVDEAIKEGRGSEMIAAYVTTNFEYVHPDEPLEIALERFGKTPELLPVLSRSGNLKA
jgi:hypothetical protein